MLLVQFAIERQLSIVILIVWSRGEQNVFAALCSVFEHHTYTYTHLNYRVIFQNRAIFILSFFTGLFRFWKKLNQFCVFTISQWPKICLKSTARDVSVSVCWTVQSANFNYPSVILLSGMGAQQHTVHWHINCPCSHFRTQINRFICLINICCILFHFIFKQRLNWGIAS